MEAYNKTRPERVKMAKKKGQPVHWSMGGGRGNSAGDELFPAAPPPPAREPDAVDLEIERRNRLREERESRSEPISLVVEDTPEPPPKPQPAPRQREVDLAPAVSHIPEPIEERAPDFNYPLRLPEWRQLMGKPTWARSQTQPVRTLGRYYASRSYWDTEASDDTRQEEQQSYYELVRDQIREDAEMRQRFSQQQ